MNKLNEKYVQIALAQIENSFIKKYFSPFRHIIIETFRSLFEWDECGLGADKKPEDMGIQTVYKQTVTPPVRIL